MKKRPLSKSFLTFFLLSTITNFLNGDEAFSRRAEREFTGIAAAVSSKYAPEEWKREYLGWNLQEEIEERREKLKNGEVSTPQEYQQFVKEFFNSFKDYHVGVRFYSTAKAELPFTLKEAQGKYYINSLDGYNLRDEVSLSLKDQVIAIDGEEIESYLERKAKEWFLDLSIPTDKRFAVELLTTRIGRAGDVMPENKQMTLTLLSPTGEEKEATLSWYIEKENIVYGPQKGTLAGVSVQPLNQSKLSTVEKNKTSFFKKSMTTFLADRKRTSTKTPFQAGLENRSLKKIRSFIGEKESVLPFLGEVIWEAKSSSPFQAYIFKNEEGKKYGFLRISSYEKEEEDEGEQKTKFYIDAFRSIIQKMEKETEGLIIDEMENPGGEVFYLYKLVSYLISEEVEVPYHKQAITSEDQVNALRSVKVLSDVTEDLKEIIESFDEMDNDLKDFHVKKVLKLIESIIPDVLDSKEKFIINKSLITNKNPLFLKNKLEELYEFFTNLKNSELQILEAGQKGENMTDSLYLYGIKTIKPHPQVKYTKPLVVLADELSFSGGDFFPSILQDAKRAIIMGRKTAGAGGFVIKDATSNRNGISFFRFTGSIAERPYSHLKLENLGVTPDVEYQLTEQDILEDYAPFGKKVVDVLEQQIKKKNSD